MTDGTVSTLTIIKPAAGEVPDGRACSSCGSRSNLLVPAGEGTWVCMNMQRCGGSQ